MNPCSILFVEPKPLLTLAYADRLHLLMASNRPIKTTDLVYEQLYTNKNSEWHKKVLSLVDRENKAGRLEIICTGTPGQAAVLQAMRVDPCEQSIKIAVEDFCNSNPDFTELFLIADTIAKKTFILPKNIYLCTTAEFILEMEKLGLR